MNSLLHDTTRLGYFLFAVVMLSCHPKSSAPSDESIQALNLKRGDVIACGPPDAQWGSVNFGVTGGENIQNDFNLAMALLHSFEYDEAEKVFAKIIDQAPGCAMAYWGVAMCNFHALWSPPTEAELKKGRQAIAIARSITGKSEKESAYIHALSLFYQDWEKQDHHTRCMNFEQAMEQLHEAYPDDREAAVFYALSLDAAADPEDKSYRKQRKAGALLTSLSRDAPDHPGIIHYIIHTYDYPELATLALPAAEKYAQVAPSSAHALHMPSHIFTRLGLWDRCISSNLQSIEAAKCYAESSGIPGHWDEELHGLDYLVYAYLQKGANEQAKKQVDYLHTIRRVNPVNFKVAYAFAAIPCRYVLENKHWQAAASLEPPASNLSWKAYPWQEAIIHFTRLLGAVHTQQLPAAKRELQRLQKLQAILRQQKDDDKSMQVAIQIKAGEAWIRLISGDETGAVDFMTLASDMEDRTSKHPVTPGEVLPARELLGDMFLAMNDYQNALQAYESVLLKCPNRFNSLFGAGLAAEKSGKEQKAMHYYRQLSSITGSTYSDRQELGHVRAFLSARS